MLNNVKQHLPEVGRISAELRDRVQERWNITYFAVEEIRGSLEREFGEEVLTGQDAPAPVAAQPVRITGDVINLETRSQQQFLREHRELTAREQELEILSANAKREAA